MLSKKDVGISEGNTTRIIEDSALCTTGNKPNVMLKYIAYVNCCCKNRAEMHADLGFLTSVMPLFRCRAQNSACCPPPSRPKYGCTEQPPGCLHRLAATFTAPVGACAAQYLAGPGASAVGVVAGAAAGDPDPDADSGDASPSPITAPFSKACESAAVDSATGGVEGTEKGVVAGTAALLEGNRVQPGCKHVLCFVSTMPPSLCSFIGVGGWAGEV